MPILTGYGAVRLSIGDREIAQVRELRFAWEAPSLFAARPRDESAVTFGAIGAGFSASVSFPISREDYARFVAPFLSKREQRRSDRPRWGQPGRRRRRKARLAARRAARHSAC